MSKLKIKLFPIGGRRKQNHYELTSGQTTTYGTYLTKDLELFAVNILKELKSKKLKP